jgi:hypothetical protein
MFQPKKSWHTEYNKDYFVSPRMHIRFNECIVRGVMYGDCISVQTIYIGKEVGGPWS